MQAIKNKAITKLLHLRTFFNDFVYIHVYVCFNHHNLARFQITAVGSFFQEQ